MKGLKIANDFTLPAAIGTQTCAILGIRGSGKTVTATVIVEELLDLHHQVVIIDPTDVWWGLKSSGDGSKAGYPVVIFGGPHGDLPLEANMGAALADFAVEQRVPMILSLRHLRKGKQQTFVTEFAEQLYHRKGETEHRTALLVAIDEASAFVPQRVGGAEARMVGAIEDLVRRGRSAGLGVALIDQRPASVNKDVLTQLEVLVAHRITSPQDRKAIDEWVRQHDTESHRDTFLEQLSSLPQGAAWFWSPTLDVFERVQVRMRHTFDSSKTPKPGEDVTGPTAWADVDMDALREQISAAVEEAAANDPKELKKRVAELEEQVVSSGPDPKAIDRAVQEATRPLSAQIEQLMGKVSSAAELAEKLAKLLRNGSAPPITTETGTPQPVAAAPAPVVPKKPQEVPTGGLTEAEQRIIDALGTYAGFGQMEVARPAVAAIAGYKQGGYFNTAVKRATDRGLITDPAPGHLALTAAGRKVAKEPRFDGLDDLHMAWYRLLDSPQSAVLAALLKAYPKALSRDEISAKTGFKPGGYFNTAIKRLEVIGAAEYPQQGFVRASDLLFPELLK